jgi:glucan phosphoethanolaminetransferase (alkaline phosphatase superfamily)
MKEKLGNAIQRFIPLTLACIPVLLLIRIWEYFSLSGVTELPPGGFWLEMLGFAIDIPAWFAISLVLMIPYLLISLYSQKLAAGVHIILAIIVLLIHLLLVNYFIITLVPLDQVIFSYNIREMMMITKSSVSFSFMTFLPVISLIIAILLSQYLFRNLHLNRIWRMVVFGLITASPFIMNFALPGENAYRTNFAYHIASNKSYFFTSRCLSYKWKFTGQTDISASYTSSPGNDEDILSYQQNNPRFTYFGTSYPLLHTEDTRDILGAMFNFTDQKPNLVFIIIESFSPSFFNEEPWFGNFMPFLDSLSSRGLYFPNFLSTSDRTFNALPAIFGSLPWSDGTFLNPNLQSRYHMSMIRYLHRNGYRTSFFYGGNPDFNTMRYFIFRESGDYVLNYFGPEYQRLELNQTGYSWGYPDRDVFNRSFGVIDSLGYNPRLDIYLTLSMHEPFTIPGQEKYLEKFRKRMKEMDLNADQSREILKHKDIFSTILYTDDAIREFFSNYKKRADYANTIFVITGDHSMPELNPANQSALERFHVPLIIYSPMLKQPRKFNSVSSHLDITPTLLAMLQANFAISLDPVSHWLGSEIDTSSAFRNTKSQAFVLNNKDIVDYVRGDEYILSDRYFRILPGLKLDMTENKKRSEALKKELATYIRVTNGTAAANRIIPGKYYYGKDLRNEFFEIGEDVDFTGKPTRKEFYGILMKQKFGREYKHLDFDFSFRLTTSETDPKSIPLLVLEIYDENGQMIRWNCFDIIQNKYHPGDAGKPFAISVSSEIDLSYVNNLENKSLKMYLWNPKKILIGYDSLTRIITGYY